MRLLKRSTGGALLVSLALVLSACSSGDPEPGGSDPVPADSASGAEPDPDPGDAVRDEPAGDGGAYTADDVGSGVLRVDGVEYAGFLGDCQISRGSGAEDVGDLSMPGLSVIVAIDNVSGPTTPEVEAIFTMINERDFRTRGIVGDPTSAADPAGRGTIDSIGAVGPRSSSGTRDYVLAAFAGTTEAGVDVVAEVVCEVQNAF